MQVEVVRTGGFAGLREVVASYDSDALSAEKASHLRELADAVLGLPVPDQFGADGFLWETTIRDENGEHTVVVPGETEPDAEPVRQLVAGP